MNEDSTHSIQCKGGGVCVCVASKGAPSTCQLVLGFSQTGFQLLFPLASLGASSGLCDPNHLGFPSCSCCFGVLCCFHLQPSGNFPEAQNLHDCDFAFCYSYSAFGCEQLHVNIYYAYNLAHFKEPHRIFFAPMSTGRALATDNVFLLFPSFLMI